MCAREYAEADCPTDTSGAVQRLSVLGRPLLDHLARRLEGVLVNPFERANSVRSCFAPPALWIWRR